MRRIGLGMALAVALAFPGTASAGTYTVYACHGAAEWGNGSFGTQPAPGYGLDTTCEPGINNISVNVAAGTSNVPGNTAAALVFSAPAGDTIADFRMRRYFRFDSASPPAGSHAFYEVGKLGSTVYEGAGNYDDGVRSALTKQGRWYGTNRVRNYQWVSRSSFPALAGYAGKARTLSLVAGCFPRTTPCTLPAGGLLDYALFSAEVTVSDVRPPGRLDVEAFGLLTGGAKVGSEPVRLSASDSAGIQKVRLLDVTNPAVPQTVAEEDYTQRTTDIGARCNFSLAAPCPALNHETIAAGGLPGGTRQVVVQAVDPAGNVLQRGPYTVEVVPPVDRGALNGAGATETGTLSVRFKHGHRTSRTVHYGSHVKITGKVTNAAGAPVTGAKVELITADLRLGAQWRRRATLETSSSGYFHYRVKASAARRLQFGWKSHVNDHFYTASRELRLWARASAQLKVRPRVVAAGHRIRLSGRLRGYHFPHNGKIVELQAYERHRWRTFDTVRASRRGAYHTSYRFTRAAGGRRFTFRVRIRRESTFAYSLGYSNHARVRVV